MKPDIDWTRVKIVLFDLFGTVFKLDRPDEEIRAYGEHIRKPEWSPLVLPDAWGKLECYEDVVAGIASLSYCDLRTATLSNAPYSTQMQLGCDVMFRYLVPLESYQVFKPRLDAYVAACIFLRRLPSDMLMVTANEHFGDLEAARSLGMQAILIDREGKYPDMPHTIAELGQMAEAVLDRPQE